MSAGVDVLVEQTLARAGLYRLLGRALGYPTRSVLDELAEFADRLVAAPAIAPAIRSLLRQFATSAREADAATVADEYVFLFDRQVPCPPYESAYGSVPQMAGKSSQLADVAGFYTAFGLATTAAQPDIEDHIAAELEFMSVLAVKEAYALAEGHVEGLEVVQPAERAFLDDHLGRWAETFARGLRAATPLPYYAAAAELLGIWMRAELEAFGVTPAVLDAPHASGPLEDDTFTCPMVGSPAGDERMGNG
jgi:putative dimethyl sulfoxide reductase chaperone